MSPKALLAERTGVLTPAFAEIAVTARSPSSDSASASSLSSLSGTVVSSSAAAAFLTLNGM